MKEIHVPSQGRRATYNTILQAGTGIVFAVQNDDDHLIVESLQNGAAAEEQAEGQVER